MSRSGASEVEIKATAKSSWPGTLPAVSVVVASSRSAALLGACLESLIGQCRRAGAELIVARPVDAEDAEPTLRAFPGVRLIVAPAGSTIPHLRAAGMKAAGGDVVALTEDNCVADAHWVASLVRGVAAGVDVVGGGMDNARRRRAVDWAAYFSEYGVYSTTRADGVVPQELVTAANVAYSRAVVSQVVEWAAQGEGEYVGHNRLGASGRVFRFVRTAAVYQNARTSFWPFCVDRYEHGRDYARARLIEETRTSRWLRLLSCPILPVLLTARIARAAGPSRKRAFVRALPAMLIFMTAWSLGEAAGYLRGPAPVAADGGRAT